MGWWQRHRLQGTLHRCTHHSALRRAVERLRACQRICLSRRHGLCRLISLCTVANETTSLRVALFELILARAVHSPFSIYSFMHIYVYQHMYYLTSYTLSTRVSTYTYLLLLHVTCNLHFPK